MLWSRKLRSKSQLKPLQATMVMRLAYDALKGYQMFCLRYFLDAPSFRCNRALRSGISSKDVRRARRVSTDRPLRVLEECKQEQRRSEYQTWKPQASKLPQFNEYRHDISMLSRLIAIPVADHLTSGESHYEDREFVARFIPMFTITTQIEIAREFRDKTTLRFLERTMQETLQATRPDEP